MNVTEAKMQQSSASALPSSWLSLWLGVLFSALFTGVIWLFGSALSTVPHLPDAGASWYFWKLAAPTWITRLSAWSLYLTHQFLIWGAIWYAQKHKLRYTSGLHKVNVFSLAIYALFIVLHLIQTHIWYDGLAQDVSINSSQYSVIVLLVWVMLMEHNRRGIFLGKKVPISQRIIQFARKYHGYYFSWAIIYTFWFHPMEATNGHLIGFFYTFLLMLQGSLFFTRAHVNRWWNWTQEIIVLAHGTMVALMNANGKWPMFFFGFLGMFVLAQMYGLPLKRWMRWAIIAGFIALAVAIYSQPQYIDQSWRIFLIPATYYAIMLGIILVIALGLFIYDRIRPQPRIQPDAQVPQPEPLYH